MSDPYPNSGDAAASREIVNRRVIAASRELIFRAFAEPEHLTQWWGPTGFKNSFEEFDFRPGGEWRFVMHGPDGTDYPNHSVFDEVVKPERIVFRHLDPVHKFQMTILLADRNGETEITWRMLFETAAHCDAVRSFVLDANEQNLDRLEAELATMQS